MPIKYLVNLTSKTLSSIGYSTENVIDPPNLNTTLKQSLIEGDPNFKIKTTNKSQFTVEIPNSTYSEMIYADFHFGYKRISKLCEEVEKQIKSGNTSAWLIVTTYYASFFAAIEISKILGRFNLNLNKSQQESILNNSIGGCGAPFLSESSVTLVGQMKPSTQYDFTTISFSNSRGKPHKLAWDNLYFYLKSISPNSKSKEYLCQQRFLDIIGPNSKSKWPKPSETRNDWNYFNPKYFTEYGEELTKQHKSIIGNYRKSINWASTRNLFPTEQNKASSLAFIYTNLILTINNIKDKILLS